MTTSTTEVTVTSEVVSTTTTTTTTNSSSTITPIHPFFAKRSTAGSRPSTAGKLITWSKDHSVLVGTYQTQVPSTKIAAFDFDHTIATVRGTHAHPKGGDDWAFFHQSIPSRLQELHQQGYRIVIMSNQKGIEAADPKSKGRKTAFLGRIENVIRAVDAFTTKAGTEPIPILVFGATADDWFRKPRPGMWELFEAKYNEDVVVDRNASFYVGDAAGRPHGWIPGYKKDHSEADLKLAANVGCTYHTPEHFFHPPAKVLKYPPVPVPSFQPREALNLSNTTPPSLHSPPAQTTLPELLILVGSPASGKSSYVKTHLLPAGYVHVNQDTLKTREACLKATHLALSSSKSVVIDNTNPEIATRKMYIHVAQKINPSIPVDCVYFTAGDEVCLHNNAYRQFGEPRARSGGDEGG
ncbi:hypothetical protein HK097_005817, partial [Rhizophlyctis rosea]